jgi:hypothetical protein
MPGRSVEDLAGRSGRRQCEEQGRELAVADLITFDAELAAALAIGGAQAASVAPVFGRR